MGIRPASVILSLFGIALAGCVPMHDDFHRYFSGQISTGEGHLSYENHEPRSSTFDGRNEETCVVFLLTDSRHPYSDEGKISLCVFFATPAPNKSIDGHAFVKVFSVKETSARDLLPTRREQMAAQGYSACSGTVSGDWTDNGDFRLLYDVRSEDFGGISIQGCYETHRGWALRPLIPWAPK